MTNNWIILMVVLPMAAGILTTLLRGRLLAQRVVGLAALGSTAVASVVFLLTLPAAGGDVWISRLGLWPAPYGIVVVFDGISGILLTAASVVGLAAFLYAIGNPDRRLERGWFHPLVHLLIMGVNFSFLTGDLFNLFVAFEIMLMASYALLCLSGGRRQISQAYKYVMLNMLASTVFVLCAGLVYGMMGTLNYADLARMVAATAAAGEEMPTGFQAVAIMLLFVFGLKGAVFPLWFWLPDTYPTLPVSIGALFAALLSKVGVYAVLRLYPMVFAAPAIAPEGVIMTILPITAAATMLIAILGAVSATTVRGILSLVLISHVGYLLFGVYVGIASSAPDALAATLFYMAQEMLVIGGLFICAGMIIRHAGSDDLHEIGGLGRRAPWLATCCFVLCIGAAGLPPMAGFYGKILFLREGFAAEQWVLSGAILVTSLLTLIALLKLWASAFWRMPRGTYLTPPAGATLGATPRLGWAFAGLGLLTGASVLFGVGAEPAITFVARAESDAMAPRRYVEAVLGPASWPSETVPMRLARADETGAAPAGEDGP